jgi:hypothetical protein
MNDAKISISDKWMFIYVYPLLAMFVVHIGNENTIVQLLQIPSYYSDLVLALGCSFAIGIYLKKLFEWMDRKIPLADELKRRLSAQLLFGIVLPTAILFLIESVYLGFLDIKLEDSSIFYLELPLIFIFCLLVNLIYFVLNYPQYVQSFPDQISPKKNGKSHFAVQKGRRLLNIPIDKVAYFKIQNKLTFLVTKEGESYMHDFPFKEILPGLPHDEFYQLNRQVIAKRDSIIKSIPTDTRRLEIELFPSTDDEVFVPKTKTTEFKIWLQSA